MFGLGPATRVYLAIGATDMRKGFEGLYGLVRDRLGLEVQSGHLFLFSNARRNRLKVLYWDGYGTLAIMGRNHSEPGKSPELVNERREGRSHIKEPQETP
jgi:transposase